MLILSPQEISITKLKLETLSLEEIEVLNLKDVENMDRGTATDKMGYQGLFLKGL